jgi:hypothetical protein
MAFCTACGAQQPEGSAYCSHCGAPQNAPAARRDVQYGTATLVDDGTNFVRRIGDYERISGIIWIVLGVLQICSIYGIIAGVWNLFAGSSRLRMAKMISQRRANAPREFEGVTGLIVIGIVNLFLGGVIGILCVAFDFYIRDRVLSNRHLFDQQVTAVTP